MNHCACALYRCNENRVSQSLHPQQREHHQFHNPWRYSSDEPWPAERPPLAVFPDCTRRYWVDMWSAHRIPQLHFQLSKPLCLAKRSRSSSVSIVSDYGLDDRVIRVRFPAGAKDFSSNLCVQTGSEDHPYTCIMGTGSPFPGAKRGRGVTLTSHPHLVPRSRMSRSYTSSTPSASTACGGTALLFCGWLVDSLFYDAFFSN
jgi:hypothetical protein